MEITTNQLIEYFSTSVFQFVNIFSATLDAEKTDYGRKTANGVCGLVIPVRGHAHFSFNGTVYPMNPQSIVHAGSSMDISITTFEQDWSYVVVHYRILHTAKEFEPFLHQHFFVQIDDTSKTLCFVQKLLQHQIKPDNFSKFQLQVQFINLLESILIGSRNSQHDTTLQTINQALDYIHQHFSDELFIGELAAIFNIERRKFSLLFEQVTGMTPIQYVTEYRITHAKEMLMLSNKSIAEIAEAVGYQDSFYFSRIFKKYEGLSPSSYRKQIEKKSILI